MRWPKVETQAEREWAARERVRVHFAWWPREVSGTVVWLERYWTRERVSELLLHAFYEADPWYTAETSLEPLF